MYRIEIPFNVFLVTLNSLCNVERWNPCQDERTQMPFKLPLTFTSPNFVTFVCIWKREMMTGSHNLHIRNHRNQRIQNVTILNLCFYILSGRLWLKINPVTHVWLWLQFWNISLFKEEQVKNSQVEYELSVTCLAYIATELG